MSVVRVLLCGVCAALLANGGVGVLATPSLDAGGVARFVAFRSGRNLVDDVGVGVEASSAAAASLPGRSVDLVLDDDLARKTKRKGNVTVGEEVLTAIVDGLTGESEDSKFGSEIRDQIGILVQAVTKLGVTTINQYAGGSGGGGASRSAAGTTTSDCGQDGAGDCEGHSVARMARAVDNVGEGRRRQVRRLLVRYLVLLKVFALGIILPGAVLLSLLQSWKAVTLSLMALLLAGVIGIRGLVNTAVKGQPAEVIHSTGPGSHYWRRVSNNDQGQDPDRLAYGAYVPIN